MRNAGPSSSPIAAEPRPLTLGGLVPFSTVDYPGALAAVLFTQFCPLACRYCHNPHLRPRHGTRMLVWQEVLTWLARRRHLLDAVVISGGEPTLQPGLAAALGRLRGLGFRTGLHSAGLAPRRLAAALPMLDWVGFDVKAPFAAYARFGSAASGARARDALARLLDSGVACEVRTTVHESMLSGADLCAIARDLRALGVRRWVLTAFRPEGCTDAALVAGHAPPDIARWLPYLAECVPDIALRGDFADGALIQIKDAHENTRVEGEKRNTAIRAAAPNTGAASR